MIPRQGDRRRGPNREADKPVHYTHLAMDAALIAAYKAGESLPLQVSSAVAAYLAAEAASQEVPA